jgi:EpsI family protein
MSKALVALAFLALNFYVYHWFATDEVVPPRHTFASFPLQLGDWTCPYKQKMDAKTLENLGATDYLICNYERRNPAAVVSLYVGYHESQVRLEGGGAYENSIHPPKHCLPGSGWDIIDQQQVLLDLPGLPQRPALVNRFLIAKGEARELVYYWYQSQGRVIADDWKKIVYLSWDRATRYRTDGSLVRFSAPIFEKDEETAQKQILDLASQVVPLLDRYVPN